MPRMVPALLTLLGLYAVLCLAAVVFQERLVFVPSREVWRTPAAAGLRFEEVTFATEAGRLHGWYVPGGDVTVLMCHGNAGNVADRVETLEVLASLGLSVLIFDYAGYGLSEGRPTEDGTHRDALAARQWLIDTKGVEPSRLVYFGRSLGGAVAIALAEAAPPAALVVEATFTSIPELGQRVYPWLPVRWLSRIRYDSVPRVRTLTCPKLFMHSPADETVPYELARRLFDAAREPKRFVDLRGGHGGGFLEDVSAYRDAWRALLEEAGLTGG